MTAPHPRDAQEFSLAPECEWRTQMEADRLAARPNPDPPGVGYMIGLAMIYLAVGGAVACGIVLVAKALS